MAPTKPILLVGTKIDERKDHKYAVTKKDGENMAKKHGIVKYMECSVTTEVKLFLITNTKPKEINSTSRKVSRNFSTKLK